MNASEKRAALAGAIREGRFVVAPGVYDMISARLADRMGFEALYMTGYGVAASLLGLPDAGLATYADLENRVRTIANGTRTPLICDADTGFGGLLNVRHTVRGYEAAGCAAIQLEDQEIPKKCGHTPGRRVVPVRDMAEKVRVAVEARTDPNFLVVARTDARTSLGLDAAIERGRAYSDGRRRRDLRRGAGERGGDRADRRIHRQALARQHGRRRQDADSAGRKARVPRLRRRHLSRDRNAARRGRHAARDEGSAAGRLHRQRGSPGDLARRDARAHGLRGGLGFRAQVGTGRGAETDRGLESPTASQTCYSSPPRPPEHLFAYSGCETLGKQPVDSRLRGNDAAQGSRCCASRQGTAASASISPGTLHGSWVSA